MCATYRDTELKIKKREYLEGMAGMCVCQRSSQQFVLFSSNFSPAKKLVGVQHCQWMAETDINKKKLNNNNSRKNRLCNFTAAEWENTRRGSQFPGKLQDPAAATGWSISARRTESDRWAQRSSGRSGNYDSSFGLKTFI